MTTPAETAIKLKYGSALHKKLEEAVSARLKMSEQKMSDRYVQIAKNEETFQAYIPERDVDALRRVKRDTGGVPDYRTIEIPYSYAVAMTAHTYYTSVFLSKMPVLQLSGRHGEAETNRVAMESLLSYQMMVGEMLAPLFVWLLDPAKAGFGVIGHHWDKETVTVRRTEMHQPKFLGMAIPGAAPKAVEVVDQQTGYEGNRIYNIRPQDWFPDPRVAMIHFQKGEFAGRYVEVSWGEICDGQKSGRYFNYDVLKRMKRDGTGSMQGGTPSRDLGSERVSNLPDTENNQVQGYDIPIGFIKGHELALKLCPAEWGLGEEKRQEIWMINRSSNGVIFGAVPLGEYSGKFPFDILVDEIDGYSIFPKSMIEQTKPMNDVLTWLVNSHFYNVRQTMNNQLVVDPSMVVMKDVENPEPGKIIRLKPEMYGKDVRLAVNQLQVMDVTRGHMQDVGNVQSFLERITGVNDSIMGQLNGGDRKTATEVRTSTSFGVNRLKTKCEWFSTIGFAPLTQKLVQRTQQNYDTPRKYKLVGDTALLAPNFGMITPDQIAGFYDYEPVDGTLPVDRFAQANLWQMLMSQIVNYPQIMMQYDMAKIFAWVANLAGIKNLAQFRVLPDQQMMAQQQAGNSVPIQQASKATPNLNEPGQIPGMGATG